MALDVTDLGQTLGIQSASADLYVELLVHGELTHKKLQELMDKPQDTIQMGIDELLEKGLIFSFEGTTGEEIFHALSVLQLEERLEREKKSITALKKLIPQFQQQEKLGIMKYEGWEGIRRVYMEILDEAIRTGQPIYALENKLSSSEIGEIFLNNYVEKRKMNKVKAFVICPFNEEDKEYKEKNQGEFTEVKLIKDFNVDANINIVGDLVMAFSVSPQQGTLRRNKAEANTWRTLFEFIWELKKD
ncbi:MAG: helix-turn-helix domain-containing protein [bacterium]|nr:helix-turn-helix domain-containing protein [bacterium]